MKRTLLLIQSLMMVAPFAHADVTLKLPFAHVNVQSAGDDQKNIFLISEAKRAYTGISLAGMQLKSAEVAGVAGMTGATLTLKLGDNFVDSGSAEGTGAVERVKLESDGGAGDAWRVGVRGQLALDEILLTVSGTADQEAKLQAAINGKTAAAKGDISSREELAGGNTQPTTPPVQPTNPPVVQPTNPPVVQPTQPSQPASELAIGQRVLGVSRSSGIIDYVVVESYQGNGVYTVLYHGNQRLTGFGRNQLAVIEGCNKGICVGGIVSTNTAGFETRSKVIGILPKDLFVIEDLSDQRRSTIPADQIEQDRPVPVNPQPNPRPEPRPTPPRPVPVNPPPVRRFDANPGHFQRGQPVLYVESDQRIYNASVIMQDMFTVQIRFQNGQTMGVDDESRVAVTAGCIDRVCVGDVVTTQDRSGARHQVEIIGFQTRDLAIIRFVEIRNAARAGWPVSALRGR